MMMQVLLGVALLAIFGHGGRASHFTDTAHTETSAPPSRRRRNLIFFNIFTFERQEFQYLEERVGECQRIERESGGGAACALGQELGEPGVGLVRYQAGDVTESCQGDDRPKYCCPTLDPVGILPSQVGTCRLLKTPGGVGPCTCGLRSLTGGWSYYDRRPATTGDETTVVCCDEEAPCTGDAAFICQALRFLQNVIFFFGDLFNL